MFPFLLFTAITRTLMAAASKASKVPLERLSQKRAVLSTARRLTALLLKSDRERAKQVVDALMHGIAALLELKYRKSMCLRRSFRPRPRWGPHGRLNSGKKGQLR